MRFETDFGTKRAKNVKELCVMQKKKYLPIYKAYLR